MKKLLIGILGLCMATAAMADCQTTALTPLIQDMANRAALMQSVAAIKWSHVTNHKATAFDAAQEIKVLNAAQAAAEKYHLNVPGILVFAQIQMDLSTQIEAYWLNQWTSKQPSKASMIPLRMLREKITQLDTDIFLQLSQNQSALASCSVEQIHQQVTQYFVDKKGQPIAGIPQKPDFGVMLSQALKGVMAS